MSPEIFALAVAATVFAEGAKFGPRREAKSLGAGFCTRQKKTREPHALLAREYHDKEVCGVSFGNSPSPRRGEPLSVCLPSLFLALFDEKD